MTDAPTGSLTPFEEDALVCRLATRIGMEVSRTESIRVTDEASLKRQGLMRSTPDYPKIRRLLNEGVPVFGVKRGGYEFIFRRPREKENDGPNDSANE